MRYLLFACFISGLSVFAHAQCWEQLSGLYALKNDGTIWNFANGDTIQVGTDTNWTAVSTGYDHTLALKSNGTLWGWGSGSAGQLGLGMLNPGSDFFNDPVQIGADTNWALVSAGNTFSMAVKTNGVLYVTGSGTYGKLGLGSTFSEYVFTPVNSLGGNVAAISAGGNGSFLLKNNGSLWYSGSRYYFDTNGSNYATTFEQVGTDTNWVYLSAGQGHLFLLKSDSTLWGTGYNGNGEVGDGTYSYVNGLTQIGTAKWIKVIAGNFASRGIKQDGSMYLWGNSGNNMFANPVQIGESTSWTDCSIHMGTQEIGLYLTTSLYESELDNCGIHLGLESPETTSLSVYPNPANSCVTVSGFAAGSTITLLEHTGKVLRDHSTANVSLTIEMTSLESGVYFLHITNPDGAVHLLRVVKN